MIWKTLRSTGVHNAELLCDGIPFFSTGLLRVLDDLAEKLDLVSA